jgi:hypothetical protein
MIITEELDYEDYFQELLKSEETTEEVKASIRNMQIRIRTRQEMRKAEDREQASLREKIRLNELKSEEKLRNDIRLAEIERQERWRVEKQRKEIWKNEIQKMEREGKSNEEIREIQELRHAWEKKEIENNRLCVIF